MNPLLLCVVFKLVSSTAIAGHLLTIRVLLCVGGEVVARVGEMGAVHWGGGPQKLTFPGE